MSCLSRRRRQVISVGPGALNRDGKLVPTTLKVGDKVLLPEYGGTVITTGAPSSDAEFVLYRDEDILARIEE